MLASGSGSEAPDEIRIVRQQRILQVILGMSQ